jgi:hypothetical protein
MLKSRPGTVVALGGSIQTYTGLSSGQQTEVYTTVDIVRLPTSGPIVRSRVGHRCSLSVAINPGPWRLETARYAHINDMAGR